MQSSSAALEKQKKRERPGKSDEDRSLGDKDARAEKRMKTLDNTAKEEDNEAGEEEAEASELYQHIKEAKKTDTQILDAATKVGLTMK